MPVTSSIMNFGFPKKSLILLAVCTTCLFAGCMQRRLTIRSNPPGAQVYVDDVAIGSTPVSIPFTYYGTRTIRLEKDRYQTVEVQKKINAPWYQVPPLDLITDVLVPFEIRDEREVHVDLQVLQPTNETEVLQRANQMRGNVQSGIAGTR